MPLSRATIAAKKVVTVPLSDGESVCIRVMSGKTRDQWRKAIKDIDADAEHFYTSILVRTLCDESGKLLYAINDEKEMAEAQAELAEAQAPRLEEMFGHAMLINGVGEKAEAAIKKTIPANDGSGTSSPVT